MPSPAARKRVSQACRNCASKKIKCGGELPRCLACIVNHRACSYGTSKRNTRSRKIASEASSNGRLETRTSTRREEVLQLLSSADYLSSSDRPFAEPGILVSPNVSARLFRTYFTCIHPIWPILYKPLYASINYLDLVKELPKPLVLSVFAIAACIYHEKPTQDSSELEDRAQDEGPSQVVKPSQFFDAALAELGRAENGNHDRSFVNALRPSVSHCQALTLLALQQHGVAEFSLAGVLCGLASAMAIDLRLHKDCWSHDPIQQEVHSHLWWNIFVLEKMLSFEMGRPVMLRSEETDSPYPSTSESDEFELFTPTKGRVSTNRTHINSIKLRTISTFHTSIELTKIMEHISREVYSVAARQLIRQDRGAGDVTRMKLWAELEEWQNRIEKSPLKLDLSENLMSRPVTVTNYVIAKSTTILLHRPFISHWLRHLGSFDCPPFDTTDPSEVCVRAANDICTILEKYSYYLPQLPCDLIFSIFIAAATLHGLKQAESGSADTRRRLRLCISWLSIFGKSWENAGARQKLLAEYEDQSWPMNQDYSTDPTIPIAQQPMQHESGRHAEEFPGFVTNVPVDESQGIDLQPMAGDWDFLHGLGDVTDDFYSMDVEFRSVLERQIDPDNPMSIF